MDVVANTAASAEKPAQSLPELVTFRNVTKIFGSGPDAQVAIKEVSFVVHDLPDQGEMISIVGPSGCGKSTVLRTIAGLTPHFPPTSGEALIFGKPIVGPDAQRGLVDQKYSLLPHLRVVDNIAFGLKLRGVSRNERRAQACEWVKKLASKVLKINFHRNFPAGCSNASPLRRP